MKKTICDNCQKETKRNYAAERLVVSMGDFKAEVLVSYRGCWNDGDLCKDCLMKLLNTGHEEKE